MWLISVFVYESYSDPVPAKHTRLDLLAVVAVLVYRAAPCSVDHDLASLDTISDYNSEISFITHKAEAMLNDFAISRGSLEARICWTASLASMSERVRMYSITPCSWLTSVCKALCFRRNDVRRDTSGSMSYTQVKPFSTQRWHEFRWPLHCWELSALCKITENDGNIRCNSPTCLCFSPSTRNTSYFDLGSVSSQQWWFRRLFILVGRFSCS